MSMPPFGISMNDNGTSKPSYKWRRVLLKVSGEALAGDQKQNIDPKVGIGANNALNAGEFIYINSPPLYLIFFEL